MNEWLRPIVVAALTVVVAGACSAAQSSKSPAASVPAGFPIGSWTNTITADDLSAAGVTDPAELAQAGPQTLTFAADGTWTHVSPNARPDPVFRGTIAVTGEDTFEMRTTFPTELSGEVVTIKWRLDSGQLLLDAVDPPVPMIATQMETHPWSPAP